MRRALHAILASKLRRRSQRRRVAHAARLMLLVLPAACTAGLPDGGRAVIDAGAGPPDDAGAAGGDAGPALAIAGFGVLPVPVDDEVEVSWRTTGAVDGCTLSDAGGAFATTALGAAGDGVRLAASFASAAYRLDATLRCTGQGSEVTQRLMLPVPHIVRYEATPPVVAVGEQTVLCWSLEGGVEPVCAIFAEATDEYYYPLEATGCLFPLTVEVDSSFKLYCSPSNGYVEQTLVVEVNP